MIFYDYYFALVFPRPWPILPDLRTTDIDLENEESTEGLDETYSTDICFRKPP